MRAFSPILAASVILSLGGTAAFAQTPVFGAGPDTASQPIAGWAFTPAVGYAGTWDDNALVIGTGDQVPTDYTNTINPRALLAYTSRRTQFSSSYDGAFTAYRELNSLNSFDQHLNVSGRRYLTPHLAWFARGSFADTPTTDLLGLVGVPFVRLGSQLLDARGGIEFALTKHTSIVASYGLQRVDFDRDPLIGVALIGGHSQGGNFSIRHALNARVALIGDVDSIRATLVDNSHFNVQNGDGGVEVQLSRSTRVFGAFGMSRLSIQEMPDPLTGPAWRAGLSRRFGASSLDVGYNRAFVPSYSFGGTAQNEELMSSLTMPIARRVYTRSALSWRRNQPLTIGGLRLKSIWIDGTVGYTLRAWLQIEGFYSGTHQTIDRPGGQLDRNRIGFQIITAKPVRIR